MTQWEAQIGYGSGSMAIVRGVKPIRTLNVYLLRLSCRFHRIFSATLYYVASF